MSTVQISANLTELNRALQKYAKKFNVNLGKAVKAMSLEIIGDIINESPVDTGRFRAGWIPFANKYGAHHQLRSSPTTKVKPLKVRMAQQEGLSSCRYKANFSGETPIADVTNNVKYGIFLETGVRRRGKGKKPQVGGSKQAKPGWIAAIIKRHYKNIKSYLKDNLK